MRLQRTVRVCSPSGEHFIVCGQNAPDDASEDALYALMRRIRDYDVNPSFLAESDPCMWVNDPEYEPESFEDE